MVYRDLKRDGYDNHCEFCEPPKPGQKIIKSQIIPGMYGFPDMYIRYLGMNFRDKEYRIISYTDYEVNKRTSKNIIKSCIRFIENQRQ